MRHLPISLVTLTLMLAFPACTKHASEEGGGSGEAVEGASTAASESNTETPPDEMQQKEKKDDAPETEGEKPAGTP